MNLGELRARLFRRLDAPADGSGQWTVAEANLAINRAQAVFAWLSLSLPKTSTASVTTSAVLALQTAFPGWLAPFRLSVAGERVYPASVAELDSRYSDWRTSTEITRRWRYVAMGVNYLRLAPVPLATVALVATYAGTPATLALDASAPEVAEEHHEDLLDYAVWRCRWKGSAGELAAAQAGLLRFWLRAAERAALVRGMVRAESLDTAPPEMDKLPWPSPPKP